MAKGTARRGRWDGTHCGAGPRPKPMWRANSRKKRSMNY